MENIVFKSMKIINNKYKYINSKITNIWIIKITLQSKLSWDIFGVI